MRYISKQFLSPDPHETGSVVTQVETPRVKDLSAYNYSWDGSTKGESTIKPDMDAYVWFRACHGEPVKLDFNCHDQRSFEKRVAKIGVLIDELTKMRGQMTEMWYSHLRDIEFKMKELKEETKK